MTLFTAQSDAVLSVLKREGICYSKREYVEKKYGAVSPVFLTAYGWFVSRAASYVPLPDGAEYPYWLFRDPFNVPAEAGRLLRLSVPIGECIFFDMQDWNRILQLRLIGASLQEERNYADELKARGLNYNKVMLSSFYPEDQQKILQSWDRLLRHHEKVRAGDLSCAENLQAAVFRLKREWFEDEL
ncbi:MAG: DUF3841 domain-containing protein [Firmicutes bacterium]|nr:DUF3841 domain-containing protein [Bacillota bacterium]